MAASIVATLSAIFRNSGSANARVFRQSRPRRSLAAAIMSAVASSTSMAMALPVTTTPAAAAQPRSRTVT
jgi:hypothetical protein